MDLAGIIDLIKDLTNKVSDLEAAVAHQTKLITVSQNDTEIVEEIAEEVYESHFPPQDMLTVHQLPPSGDSDENPSFRGDIALQDTPSAGEWCIGHIHWGKNLNHKLDKTKATWGPWWKSISCESCPKGFTDITGLGVPSTWYEGDTVNTNYWFKCADK